MSVSGAGLLEELPLSDQVGWPEYWRRIEHITDQLNQLQSGGAYQPNILIGISNGGLLLADAVLRLVYANSIPLICLWAFRAKEKYFENEVNDALITPSLINSLVNGDVKQTDSEKIRILVMDDIVGTRRTFKQLVEYFEERLGPLFEKIEIRFVLVYTPRDENLHDLADFLLSEDRNVARKHKPVVFETVTKKLELPYQKNIHYGDVVKEPSASNPMPDNDAARSKPEESNNIENLEHIE